MAIKSRIVDVCALRWLGPGTLTPQPCSQPTRGSATPVPANGSLFSPSSPLCLPKLPERRVSSLPERQQSPAFFQRSEWLPSAPAQLTSSHLSQVLVPHGEGLQSYPPWGEPAAGERLGWQEETGEAGAGRRLHASLSGQGARKAQWGCPPRQSLAMVISLPLSALSLTNLNPCCRAAPLPPFLPAGLWRRPRNWSLTHFHMVQPWGHTGTTGPHSASMQSLATCQTQDGP